MAELLTATREYAAGFETEFYDPRGKLSGEPIRYDLRLTSDSPRVCIVSNGFPGTPLMSDGLLSELAIARPQWRLTGYTKQCLSGELTADEASWIATEFDATISIYGHCGSCTSGTVRDAVTLALKEKPSIALVTHHFADCGSMVAEGVGMPGIPQVMLPYPIAQLSLEDMRKVAADAVNAIVEALETGR